MISARRYVVGRHLRGIREKASVCVATGGLVVQGNDEEGQYDSVFSLNL